MSRQPCSFSGQTAYAPDPREKCPECGRRPLRVEAGAVCEHYPPRGGRRRGSGRPSKIGARGRSVSLDARSLELVALWQKAHGCTFSAAVRQMIGLAAGLAL